MRRTLKLEPDPNVKGRFRSPIGSFGPVLVLAVLGLCLSSCGPVFYTAASQNVPLIREKGQTEANMSGSQSQVALHAAHGISDKVAVKADWAAFLPHEFGSDSWDNNHTFGTYGEVGAGYYTTTDGRFILEVFAFTGYGRSKNRFRDRQDEDDRLYGRLDAGYWNLGIQPDFGYKSDHFELVLSARMFYLRFVDIEGDLVSDGEVQKDFLRANPGHAVVEPAITCRFGPERFKYQMQLVFLDNSVPRFTDPFPVLGTVGLTMSF